jgi:NAD(P)-dependent dehydrogenase (short-subunit alcohol dehydrogenase family)
VSGDALAGRTIVVVGGTSGMGRATARAAAARGATVVAAGRRPAGERSPLDGVTEAVVDVASEASVRALFDGLDRLDHVFVTATSGRPGLLLDQDLAAARSFMDGKFFGSWTCARYAAPLLPPGGSITFVTGGAVERPPRGGSMVTAAFAALEGLTRALAIELGPIRVNTIRPGYTDSEMWDGLGDEARVDLRRRVGASLLTGRMGSVDDVADAALFLMANPQVTGTILTVDGGETLVDPLEAQR